MNARLEAGLTNGVPAVMGILTPAQIEHMGELREAHTEKAGKGGRLAARMSA